MNASPRKASVLPARAIAPPRAAQAPARPGAGRGKGGPIPGARVPETVAMPKFLRTQVSGVGGVSRHG